MVNCKAYRTCGVSRVIFFGFQELRGHGSLTISRGGGGDRYSVVPAISM